MARAGYLDRVDAGRQLAPLVADHVQAAGEPSSRVVVLGLARGGVPVAAAVAERLGAPFDALTIRKVGAPQQPELAIGAIARGDVQVLNHELIRRLHLGDAAVTAQVERAGRELRAREQRLHGDRAPLDVTDRLVVLVDDGLATGASMHAAVRLMREAGARVVVVAVPVGAPESVADVEALADAVICPLQPRSFSAVGQWYDDFSATSDDDVRRLLSGSH